MARFFNKGIKVDNIQDAAKELDKVIPTWFFKIDINQLDMTQSNKCILGQLYGNLLNQEYFYISDSIDSMYTMSKHPAFGAHASKNEWIKEIKYRIESSEKNKVKKTLEQFINFAKAVKLGKEIDDKEMVEKYTNKIIDELLAV